MDTSRRGEHATLRGGDPKKACGVQGRSLERYNPRFEKVMNHLIRGVKTMSEESVFIFVSKKRLV